MKKLLIILSMFLIITNCQKSESNIDYIFLVTIDGLRWQEVFNGADRKFIGNTEFVKDTTSLIADFWDDDPIVRREKLMPFFWKKIKQIGQIHGNRDYDNNVNLTNNFWFSYPGYSEILTGFADDKQITSNKKFNNPNKTILEIINEDTKYKGKVTAFGSWDVFPFIINEERSGIHVNAGFAEPKTQPLTEAELTLMDLQKEIIGPWHNVRLDPFTHYFMMEHIKKKQPDITYIAYGEPDDWAHGEKYDNYLRSTQRIDRYIKELWQYIQDSHKYKNRTTMIITTDHGRGVNDNDWSGHGTDVVGADQTWIAAIGHHVKHIGEAKNPSQLYTNQIAKTILEVLNFEYDDDRMGKAIEEITSNK